MPGNGLGTAAALGGVAVISGLLNNMLEKHQQQMTNDQGIRDKLNTGQYTMPEIQMLMGDKKNAERISGGDKTFWDLQMKNRQMKDQMAKWVGQYTAQGGDLTNQAQMGKFFTQQNANMPGGLSPELLGAEQGMLKEAEPMSKARMEVGGKQKVTETQQAGMTKRTGMTQTGAETRQQEKDKTAITVANIHAKAAKDVEAMRVKGAQTKKDAFLNKISDPKIRNVINTELGKKGNALATDLNKATPPTLDEVNSRVDQANATALSAVLSSDREMIEGSADANQITNKALDSLAPSLLFYDPAANKMTTVAAYRNKFGTDADTGGPITAKTKTINLPPALATMIQKWKQEALTAAGPSIKENRDAVSRFSAEGPPIVFEEGASEPVEAPTPEEPPSRADD